jgi:hypothetical protein
MFVSLGAIGIFIGAAACVAAAWLPAHKARLERWGGTLFLAGLATVGFAVPML